MKNYIHFFRNLLSSLLPPFGGGSGWGLGSFVALFFALSPVHAQFAGGAGTEGDPYRIATPAQLELLATYVNNSATAPPYYNKHYRLTANIDLSAYQTGSGWTPIGTLSDSFEGVFDGDGYSITGLKINNTSRWYIGLFGFLFNAKVKNITVVNADIISNLNDEISFAGVIAGFSTGSTITNCHTSGSVSGRNTLINSAVYVGGIAGKGSNLSGCSSSCTLSSTSTENWTPSYAGGITGYGRDITGCHTSGTITATSSSQSYAYSGGITAEGINVWLCYSTAAVTATSNQGSHAGGIAGRAYGGNIYDCYTTGKITANGYGYAGGIVGENYGYSYNDAPLLTSTNGAGSGAKINWNMYYHEIKSLIFSCWTISEVVGGSRGAGGIAGRNSYFGTIVGCAAFNPSITSTAENFGRVAYSTSYFSWTGETGKLGNNVAFFRMINPSGGVDWKNNISTMEDGFDFNYETIISDGTICGRFKPVNGWTVENGKLPGLDGQTVDIPAFLITPDPALLSCYNQPFEHEEIPIQPLTLYEYWFNDGFATRKQISITTPDEQFTLDEIDASECGEGVHALHFRMKDEKNRWTVVYSQPFYVRPAAESGPVSNLNYYEYWFDRNFASRKKTSVPAAQQFSITNVDASSCSAGAHQLNYRVRDVKDQWSVVYSQPFTVKSAAEGVATPINYHEYWFDDGFAARKQTTIPSATLFKLAIADAASCAEGAHKMHYRSRDVLGQWSVVYSQAFYKQAQLPAGAANLITGYRYWVDDLPAATVTLSTPANPYELNSNLALPAGLNPAAPHTFYIQFCDTRGNWSVWQSQTFVFGEIKPVTGITLNAGATAVAGTPITLSAAVEPAGATFKQITWTMVDAGTTGAVVSAAGVFTATAAGTAIVRATISNGKGSGEDYVQNFNITVSATKAFVPVAEVALDLGVSGDLSAGTTLILSATVEPAGATNARIVWSVVHAGTTGAVITKRNASSGSSIQRMDLSEDYVLTTTGTGTVVIRATIPNGLGEGEDYVKDFTLTIGKGAGATITIPVLAGKTANSIAITAVAAPVNGQTVEYACSTANAAPENGWQTDPVFTGLNANTTYYIFARAAENNNYHAGAATTSVTVTTDRLTGIEDLLLANPLKAWMRNGLLHVAGMVAGQPLSVYTAAGALVYQTIATSDETDIVLDVQGMYIVRQGKNTIKVVFN